MWHCACLEHHCQKLFIPSHSNSGAYEPLNNWEYPNQSIRKDEFKKWKNEIHSEFHDLFQKD